MPTLDTPQSSPSQPKTPSLSFVPSTLPPKGTRAAGSGSTRTPESNRPSQKSGNGFIVVLAVCLLLGILLIAGIAFVAFSANPVPVTTP